MTTGAAVVSAFEANRTDGSQQIARASFAIPRGLSACAGHFDRNRPRFPEQMIERPRSRFVHGGTGGGFDGFQVQKPGTAQTGEDYAEQLVYFPGDFLADRLGRFFSSEVRLSSIGRNRQISSLTSMKLRLIC